MCFGFICSRSLSMVNANLWILSAESNMLSIALLLLIQCCIRREEGEVLIF